MTEKLKLPTCSIASKGDANEIFGVSYQQQEIEDVGV
jgi:hypothetical protein